MTFSDDGNWLWNGQEWVPAPGAEMVSSSVIKTVVPSLLIVASLLFVLLSPSLSPFESIKDSDGDGYSDDMMLQPFTSVLSKHWAMMQP